MKIYITVDDVITSSGRYPERANSPELTDEVKSNIAGLVNKVNRLLTEIKWNRAVDISSGFRPSNVNANVKGSAKRSLHMTGQALDIVQPKDMNELGLLIRKTQNNEGIKGILGRNGLMMENVEATVGKNTNWVHLDVKMRSPRPSMEFKP